MKLVKTDASHPYYLALVKKLDQDLAVTDGEDHAFYNQFNKSDQIRHVVVAYANERPVACGAIKQFDDATMEVKRMFTDATARGRGIAGKVLAELEAWAAELGFTRLILETGTRQVSAIRLYEKHGYRRMPENYAQYAGVENSVCMEKYLS